VTRYFPPVIVRGGAADPLCDSHPFIPEARMKKLKLALDDLKVDSFVSVRSAPGRGTVRGQSWSTDQRDTYAQCSVGCQTGQNTWAESCQYGTGCQDSIFVCDSDYCPLTGAPSAPNC
jgi:hypothetical protein